MFSGPISRTSRKVEEILWLHFSLNMAMSFFSSAPFAGNQEEDMEVQAKQLSGHRESLLSFASRGDRMGFI